MQINTIRGSISEHTNRLRVQSSSSDWKGHAMNTSATPGELRDELRRDVQNVTQAASDRLHRSVDRRKGAAVEQAKTVTDALGKVSGELDQDAPEWLKSAVSKGAHSLNSLVQTIDAQDSRQLIENVKGFARENPGSFLAGCAAVGFAASRVFMAGSTNASGNSAGMGPGMMEPGMMGPGTMGSGANYGSYPPSNAAQGTDQRSAGADTPAIPLTQSGTFSTTSQG